MKKLKILSILVFTLLSSHLLGQTGSDIKKYKEISVLQSKKDSFEIAYNYCKLPSLQKQIQKMDEKLAKEKQQNKILLNRVDSVLSVAYHIGDSLYEHDQYDLALPVLSQIMALYDVHISVKSIDYIKVTGDLAMIFTKSTNRKNQDSAVYYFSKSIDFGNQDYDQFRLLISGFYPESKSFYMPLLDKMNKNLFNDGKDSLYTIKTVLRLMYLCDQIPRGIIYSNRELTRSSDSLNHYLLGYLIDNKLIPKFSDLGNDFTRIATMLLHSVYGSDLAFFEKYFTVYVSSMDRGLIYDPGPIDRYLNRTRQTQCFGSVKDRLPNGKFDFVPIENRDTINKILLEKLKIEPKYVQGLKNESSRK
jgi:uncharacterized ubiquitin-like protein YukD